jgi:hypothetical protein
LNVKVNVEILSGLDLGDVVVLGAATGAGAGGARRMGPPMGLR